MPVCVTGSRCWLGQHAKIRDLAESRELDAAWLWWRAGRRAGWVTEAVPDARSAFFPARLVMLGDAQVLQVSVSDAGHQHVPVSSRPGAALEVTQAPLPLELPVRLLAQQRALMAAARARSDVLGAKLLR